MLQGHAVASGAHAVSRYGQRAVVVCQSGVLHHRHVPQEGVRLSLRLETFPSCPKTRLNKKRSIRKQAKMPIRVQMHYTAVLLDMCTRGSFTDTKQRAGQTSGPNIYTEININLPTRTEH